MNIIPQINTHITCGKEYEAMFTNIDKHMPILTEVSKNYHKTNTQFMNVTVDVTDLTPQRTIMRVLAEINQTKSALQDNYFKRKEAEIDLMYKKQDLSKLSIGTKQYDLLALDILKLESSLTTGEPYLQAAVRRLNFFINQYNGLIEKFGTSATEEQYEQEETKYHIIRALKQALCAARTRGGVIDEGNNIYLFELGINGAHVQAEMYHYLQSEQELIKQGRVPTIQFTMDWMEKCADMWKDCPKQFAESRGLSLIDHSSLHITDTGA